MFRAATIFAHRGHAYFCAKGKTTEAAPPVMTAKERIRFELYSGDARMQATLRGVSGEFDHENGNPKLDYRLTTKEIGGTNIWVKSR